MTNTHKDSKKKTSVSEQLAHMCFADIADYVAHEHGWKFITNTDDTEAQRFWYTRLDYSPDIEQEIIDQAKTAVVTYAKPGANTSNIDFFNSVFRALAKYLVKYTIKNPKYNMADIIAMPSTTDAEKSAKQQAKHDAYKQAESDLFEKLTAKNKYMQNMQQHQQERKQEHNKLKKQFGPALCGDEKRKRMRVAKAKMRREIVSDIQDEFKQVSAYRKR